MIVSHVVDITLYVGGLLVSENFVLLHGALTVGSDPPELSISVAAAGPVGTCLGGKPPELGFTDNIDLTGGTSAGAVPTDEEESEDQRNMMHVVTVKRPCREARFSQS